MDEVNTVEAYNKVIDEDYNNIINFVVKNNLNSQLKIASIELKEISVTGEAIKRDLNVIEDMFAMPEKVTDKVEEKPTKKIDAAFIEDEKKIKKLFSDIPGEKIPKEEEKEVRTEIPVAIVRREASKSLQRTQDLINGLKNDRDKKPRVGFFKKLIDAVSGS